MRSVKRLLSISLLLFTLAWSVWYIYAGLGNVKDPLFWLYKYRTLESGWMAIGSILMGGACVRLFGAELLPLRIIGWVCTVGAILIPYLSLLNREERRDNLHWLALAFGLMNYAAFQELSAGTFTVPILSSIATLAVLYRRQPSVAKVIAMGLLAGLAVTVRFPNVLVLLLLINHYPLDNSFWKR